MILVVFQEKKLKMIFGLFKDRMQIEMFILSFGKTFDVEVVCGTEEGIEKR